MNTKENVLCEERKEKRKSGGRCEYKYCFEVEDGPLRCPQALPKLRRERKMAGGMMTRLAGSGKFEYGGVVWAATNERRWLCDSFCVKCVK